MLTVSDNCSCLELVEDSGVFYEVLFSELFFFGVGLGGFDHN